MIQRTAVGRNFGSISGRNGDADGKIITFPLIKLTKLDDNFVASCNPSCRNGGSCIFHNLCQCPKNFRGPQCQYSVERCSITRTGFNGGYRCTGSVAETSCTIYCPEGTDYEFSPATMYSCKYETGRFIPSTIPKCIAGNFISFTSIVIQLKLKFSL